ncbi:hypothetical protein RhiirA5_440066 [Rhizophagus irregularis]|uniref:MULE transposase domain-containing protein n=1 Tax=Rhizophagus irregularis TaxID=588596 RepID=A0A2N0NH61_9GLOM|nr:hypothetical protein RhiirA5_440066 [Rhizophagus irregularis]
MANAISSVYPITKHNLCIFHIDLNLKKNLRPKLNTQNFNEFRSEFFSCRNSLITEIFEAKWKNLINKFPEAAKYLQRMFEPTKESWANTVQKNFLLCQLESEIQNILDNEIKYERITKMHNSLPRQTLDDIPSKFFGHINEICKDFLTPHILTATQNQMKQDPE